MKCISCKTESQNSVKFPCPKCKKELKRCGKCRSLSIEYECSNCGHKGP